MLALAAIEFQTSCDVPQGGVLLALSALLARRSMKLTPSSPAQI